jgi:hypothetical protein
VPHEITDHEKYNNHHNYNNCTYKYDTYKINVMKDIKSAQKLRESSNYLKLNDESLGGSLYRSSRMDADYRHSRERTKSSHFRGIFLMRLKLND